MTTLNLVERPTKGAPIFDLMMTPTTQSLYGRKVMISTTAPRMMVSDAFKKLQAPELVRSTNEWMLQFFGEEEILPDGVVYSYNEDTLIMNKKTYAKIRSAFDKLNPHAKGTK